MPSARAPSPDSLTKSPGRRSSGRKGYYRTDKRPLSMVRETKDEPEHDTRQREKNLGMVALAILFIIIFWNTYWFLSKFLLLFIIVYVAYMAHRHFS